MRRMADKIQFHLINIVLGLIIFLAAFSAYNTFKPETSPVHISSGQASFVKHKNELVLLYSLDTQISREFYGRVTRYLAKHPENIPQFILPESEQMYKPNMTKVERIFTLPANLPTGTWCVYATLHWHPTLSIKQHTWDVPVVCAENLGN